MPVVRCNPDTREDRRAVGRIFAFAFSRRSLSSSPLSSLSLSPTPATARSEATPKGGVRRFALPQSAMANDWARRGGCPGWESWARPSMGAKLTEECATRRHGRWGYRHQPSSSPGSTNAQSRRKAPESPEPGRERCGAAERRRPPTPDIVSTGPVLQRDVSESAWRQKLGEGPESHFRSGPAHQPSMRRVAGSREHGAGGAPHATPQPLATQFRTVRAFDCPRHAVPKTRQRDLAAGLSQAVYTWTSNAMPPLWWDGRLLALPGWLTGWLAGLRPRGWPAGRLAGASCTLEAHHRYALPGVRRAERSQSIFFLSRHCGERGL